MIKKSKSIPIENLKASKAMTDNLAFVITFDPNNKSLFPVIQVTLNSLKKHMKQNNVSKTLS